MTYGRSQGDEEDGTNLRPTRVGRGSGSSAFGMSLDELYRRAGVGELPHDPSVPHLPVSGLVLAVGLIGAGYVLFRVPTREHVLARRAIPALDPPARPGC